MASSSSGATTLERVRSTAHEAELDRKIQEIQRNNRLIEERQKVRQEEARESGIPKPVSQQIARVDGGRLSSQQQQDTTQKAGGQRASRRGSARATHSGSSARATAPQWSREWDAGKLPADQWKMNVPEVEHLKSGVSSLSRTRPPGANRLRHQQHGTRTADAQRAPKQQQQQQERHSRPKAPPVPGEEPKSMVKVRNPAFFHDDRLAPNHSANQSEESGANVARKRQGGRRELAKNVKMHVDNNLSEASAQRVSAKSVRTPRRKIAQNAKGTINKDTQSNRAKIDSKLKNEIALLRQRANEQIRASDRLARNARPQRAHVRSQRNHSNTKDEVRRVVYSIVRSVCIKAGDFESRANKFSFSRIKRNDEDAQKNDVTRKTESTNNDSVSAEDSSRVATVNDVEKQNDVIGEKAQNDVKIEEKTENDVNIEEENQSDTRNEEKSENDVSAKENTENDINNTNNVDKKTKTDAQPEANINTPGVEASKSEGANSEV